jgi:DNA repair protein RadC
MSTSSAAVPVFRVQLERTGSVPCSSLHVRTARDAVEVVRKHIGEPDREHVVALFLDTQFDIIALHTAAIGNRTRVHVTAAEVFKVGLLCNADAVVLAHNHPSGSLTPSMSDRLFTAQMEVAGALLGIPVLDHVVLGSPGAVSLRELDLMTLPVDAEFDCGTYLRQRARRARQLRGTTEVQEEPAALPSREEWRGVPLDELRERLTDRIEESSLRSVARSAGVGRTTLFQFVHGLTERPHIRVRRLLALWYLKDQKRPDEHVVALRGMLAGITDPALNRAAEASLLGAIAELYGQAGVPIPAWVERPRG